MPHSRVPQARRGVHLLADGVPVHGADREADRGTVPVAFQGSLYIPDEQSDAKPDVGANAASLQH